MRVLTALNAGGGKITYEYDFGAGWIHEIALRRRCHENQSQSPGRHRTGDRAQPGRSSGRLAASLPCSRPVAWPTSMRYPSGSRM